MTEEAKSLDYRLIDVEGEEYSTISISRFMATGITGMDDTNLYMLMCAIHTVDKQQFIGVDIETWKFFYEYAKKRGESYERAATALRFLIAAYEKLQGDDLKYFLEIFMEAYHMCRTSAISRLKQ